MAKVLHLIDQGGRGGAQTVFVDLVTRIDRERWKPFAAVPDEGWVAAELRAGGIEPILTPVRHAPFDHRYLLQLIGLVRRHGIDLIHAHLLGPAIYGSMAGLITGVPVVSTFHGHVDVAPDERFRGIKFHLINRGAGAVVCVSDRLREFLLATTVLKREITHVIHNGIDVSAFQADATRAFQGELGVKPGQVLVGAIGHLRPPKAYDVFLRVAALLAERSPEFRFVIVGQPEGDLLGELTVLRDRLGLRDIVTFAGYRADIDRVIGGLDAYVITSTSEGFSLSCVQAMAGGVPVVATRCGGPEEIVADGETGLLVPVGDVAAIADAVARICRDGALRGRLVEAARVAARERFSLPRAVADYEALYERVSRS